MDTNVSQTLLFVAGGGIAGIAFYWLADAWPWFNNQAKQNKRLLFMGLSVILSLVAVGLLIALGAMPMTLEVILAGLIAGITAGYSGTVMHTRDLRDN